MLNYIVQDQSCELLYLGYKLNQYIMVASYNTEIVYSLPTMEYNMAPLLASSREHNNYSSWLFSRPSAFLLSLVLYIL